MMIDLPKPVTEPAGPSTDLIALANRINSEHDEVVKAVIHGADHAIRAGKLLLEAKIAVRHGTGPNGSPLTATYQNAVLNSTCSLHGNFRKGLRVSLSPQPSSCWNP